MDDEIDFKSDFKITNVNGDWEKLDDVEIIQIDQPLVKEDDEVENIQIDKPLLKQIRTRRKYKEKEIKKKGKKKI